MFYFLIKIVNNYHLVSTYALTSVGRVLDPGYLYYAQLPKGGSIIVAALTGK